MICSWFAGVVGLSDSFARLMFLRENNVPDIDALIQALPSEVEPMQALATLFESAYLRAMCEAAKVAFPVHVGKLILSVLLVITSAMAMSGRPNSRSVTIQAHLANAALAVVTFWLLRDVRYAAIDVLQMVRPALPSLLSAHPADMIQVAVTIYSKSSLLWGHRIGLVLFGVGLPLLSVWALSTQKTKAFFDAVAAATEDTEDL